MCARLREHLEAQCGKCRANRLRVYRMPRPDVLRAFGVVIRERGVKREKHGDRRSPRRLPLTREFARFEQIEIKARRFACFYALPCAPAHRNHRDSGWRSE